MRKAGSGLSGMIVVLWGATALAGPAPQEGAPAAPEGPPPSSAAASPDERLDVAGFRDGFFIRDPHDWFRFYPTGLLHIDFYSSFGPGVTDDPKTAPKRTALAPDVQSGLAPHLLIRRARIGFAGEFLKRWSFMLNVEFGGQPIANAAGTTETSAASAGMAPTATSGRYTAIQTITSSVVPLDAYLNFSACPQFNVMLGQVQMPFGIENQTADAYGMWMERNMPIRSFVVPGPRDIGGMIWGEIGPTVFDYALGVFGGDGQNRPSVDARVDFIGRLWFHPFAAGATSDIERYAQIGVSARHGDRDSKAVGYDYTAISTAQGFNLWAPTYKDSQKRLILVIPSGAQNVVGVELRLRAGRFALQGEGYYLVNDTREAVDGYQLTNSERFGRMKGVGWYGEVSAWPFGDPFVAPEPGIYRPKHLELGARPPVHTPHGLEMMVIGAGVNANYEGATRLGSTADPKGGTDGDITVYQLGVGATYWHTRLVRVTVNYMAYITPGSGGKDNTAVVPDNLRKLDDGKPDQAHVLHELGARVAATF
jgi:hypothetical protein